MKDIRQTIAVAGLLATIAGAGYMVVRLQAQGANVSGDFTNAASAEVRDAQGQPVLRGQFAQVDEEDDDVERKAALAAAGSDRDAAGEAEVEYPKTAPVTQEVEFSVRNLQPGAAVTFVIDGTEVGRATVDRNGRAELEVEVKMPAAQARR